MFSSTGQETTTCFPCKPDFITPLWWGEQDSLLFSPTQHAGEIDWFYFLQRASFLLFHQVCFLSTLPFPHNLSNATCMTGLHKAVGHEMYTKLTRTRTKHCGHVAERQLQEHVPGREKGLMLMFCLSKHVTVYLIEINKVCYREHSLAIQ